MDETPDIRSHARGRTAGGDVLALGFGTTSAMWAAGYIGRMPAVMCPSWVIGLCLLGCLLTGGFLAGRLSHRGWKAGLFSGFVASLLNLLILGSMLKGDAQHPAPNPLVFLPGTMLVTMLVMTLAAAVGQATRSTPAKTHANWTFRLACVAVAATAMLLLAGGLVTGREAGLAVPDWPSSYAYNMFLYPLARMTGNIYYEHTHRLVGALVGLTTIALALHLWVCERRKWMKVLAVLAVLAVIAQGVMGGLRVTQAAGDASDRAAGVEVAQGEHETTVSRALRVAHGVSGQLFFALTVAIACFVSTAWNTASPTKSPQTSTDRAFTALLLAFMLIQLLLGALLRHLDVGLMLHISVAAMVFFHTIATAARLWGLYGATHPSLKRLGIGLPVVVTLQLLLGITALVFRNTTTQYGEPTLADVTTTTAHQLTGAALLALVTATTCMTHRLLRPEETSHQG